jgi:acyl transferase domain-containing protein/phosphopantetheinyl transferase
MAALFPGAGDVGSFWRNIVDGVDSTSDVPPGRWDVDVFYRPRGAGGRPPPGSAGAGGAAGAAVAAADAVYCRRGGFVDELATFDPTAFGIMPVAVEAAEPDQLLALRLAAEAFDDAGGLDAFRDGVGGLSTVGVVLGRGGYPSAGYGRLEQRVKTAAQLATTLREVLPGLPESDVERVRSAFAARLGPERPEAMIGLVPNLAASRVANRLDLRGPAYTIDAACASSLLAVETAVRELASGRADAMVAGGSHLVHDITFWSVFSQLGALSPTERIRPFDRRADGMLVGEGIGMVVLQRLDDALRSGRRVYAVIRGCGSASDGRTSSLLSPDSAGQELALRRAWRDAGLDPCAPGAVGLIEAHGTATPAGDAAELDTLTRVFGAADDAGRAAPPIGVGSVKSMIGHAMPAAGVAGLIKAALALHHRTLPPTLYCEEPHPAFAGSRLAPVREAAGWEPAAGAPRRAGVNAFGFGGVNAHVVLEEAPDGDRPAPASTAFGVPGRAGGGASRAGGPGGSGGAGVAGGAGLAGGAGFAGGAGSGGGAGGLRVRVRPAGTRTEAVLMVAGAEPAEIAAALDAPDAELLARDDAADPPRDGPCRLALVAPTPRRLALARSAVRRGRAWRGRSDLWFAPSGLLTGDAAAGDVVAGDVVAGDAAAGDAAVAGPGGAGRRGGIAFLFCGLEDNFTPRLDDVCDHFDLPRPAVDGVDELGRHGLASIEVGRVLDAALRRLDIVPDHVGGHSIGEWNALVSAGLVDSACADGFIAGFDPARLEVPGVVFGALGCGAEAAVEAIAGLPDVVVSHDNCPHQSVVCGRADSVAAALERLRARGVLGRQLPFRSGFHSPFLRPYLGPLRDAVQASVLRRPAIPVWSATAVAPYPSEDGQIRDLLLRHLVEPVRFHALTRRLHAEGVRVFVQVGVGTLTAFIDDTLAGEQHLAVASNSPKRNGLDQLRRLAAAVWAEGGAPRTDLLPVRAGAARPSAPVAPHGGQRHGGRGVRLALGAPLVRLGSAAPVLGAAPVFGAVRPPSPAYRVPERQAVPAAQTQESLRTRLADHPVLGEFDAAVGSAADAVSDVVGRWAALGPPTAGPVRAAGPAGFAGPARAEQPRVAVPAPAGPSRPAEPAAPDAPATPVPAAGGGGVRTRVRRMSLATLPFLIDHCFYRQPPGWRDVADRFPVVPMTAIVEIMIEEARALAGGRVPVALRALRALRWLAVEPPVDVTIQAGVVAEGAGTGTGREGAVVPAGPGELAVRVSLDGYAQGTVVFADAYPQPPDGTDATADLDGRSGRGEGGDGSGGGGGGGDVRFADELPAAHTPDDLYRTWMFHGPAYRGMERIVAVAREGVRGRLVVRPAPGALLDSAGQLYGYWATRHLSSDWSLLPQSVTEIRFFGPPPAVGERLGCVVRVRAVRDKTVTADMELRSAGGAVWAHVVGWTDRRFAADDVLWALVNTPERVGLARPTGDGWVLALERWRDSASRDLVLRHYLDAAGRAELAGRNPRAAREWSLGRIAVADAVRYWLWGEGAGPVWAIEIGVGHTPAGRPVVTALPTRPDVAGFDPPRVSLAHKPELAVAIVHPHGDVGIDVEKVTAATPGVERQALADAELRLLDGLAGGDACSRALWFIRMWSAKEAAAKADGTGLRGRPRRFVVDRLARAPAGALGDPDAPPPLLARVAVAAAGGDGRDDGRRRPHVRWVASRTLDATGMIIDGDAGDAGVADAAYVVAWTSPEVETAARDLEPEGVQWR